MDDHPDRRVEQLVETGVEYVCLAAVVLPLLVLVVLIADVVIDGAAALDLAFLTGYPSRDPADAGILPAIVGSLALIALTALLTVPIGAGAAVYLEEFAEEGWFATLVEINIANLAGVPSVIYGLLGLEIFVRTAGFGPTLIAGASTLALLVLPIVIMASREALRSVPESHREAALGLGATELQTLRRVVLPQAIPGILTGTILAISRAVGETAPLIVVGALTYVTFLPRGIDSRFTVLPIQIFNWDGRPQEGFQTDAAAAIVVLLAVMLMLNAIAIYLRHHFETR